LTLRRRLALLSCLILLIGSASPARADQATDEQYLLGVPTASGALRESIRLNAESHYAGTPGDYHIATWMRDELAADGFDARLEPFQTSVPYARRLSLELMTTPKPTGFPLVETPIPQDPDGSRRDAGPPFNAWSGSGVAYDDLVDAGYGMPADYARIAAEHIDVRTRIVLIRYGRQFRGLLAERAQRRGAAGVIFFSDPAGRDGSLRGPAYPDGPYRPLGAVQRGAVGPPALRIPTLPVTAQVARRLLATIHNGISDVPVRLDVEESIKPATLWNTVGVLRGTDPTHEVVLGAHRDAWVYGVTDNGSGITTLLQTARALGYLYRSGWRPRFSIVIVGFDGEEIGEAGSQAYVRMHGGELQNGCIAYINEDEDATGQRFGAMAAAALEHLVPWVTQQVPDPANPSVTMAQRWQSQRGGPRIEGPGGGSDFESFLYGLGIPVMELGFYGPFGVYHSAFDDLRYAQTQADPGFADHRALAQMVALLAMRLASGSVPYRLTDYTPRMRAAVTTIAAHARNSRAFVPVLRAIERFDARARRAQMRGIDGNALISLTQRVDLLLYGRSGYAPVAFPVLSAAVATGNPAAITTAAGRTAHDLDAISAGIASATRR
jgi:N-acetylated-alpha-linked acidic dipeptidase